MGEKVSEHVKNSFSTMRLIVTIGWSIYPLGYFFGYLQGKVKADDLNLIYNVADVINRLLSASPSGPPPWRTPLRSTTQLTDCAACLLDVWLLQAANIYNFFSHGLNSTVHP